MREKSVYELNLQSIDIISEKLVEYCEKFKIDRKQAIRYRIAVEECLLNWLQSLPEKTEVTLLAERRLFEPVFSVEVAGQRVDPFSNSTEEFGTYGNQILSGLGIAPVYSYANNRNVLTFRPDKKTVNPLIILVIALFFAVAVGVIGLNVFSAEIRNVLVSDIIEPINNTLINIFSCIAGPLIFICVVRGVYAIGDPHVFGTIGKKMIIRFIIIDVIFGIGACCLCPAMGIHMLSGKMQSTQFGGIIQIILGIFPKSIIEPFSTGNTLQIICLAFAVGIAIIFIGDEMSSISEGVEQVNLIIQYLMKFVNKLQPCFIFIAIVKMIWSGTLNNFSSLMKFTIAFCILYIVGCCAILIYTSCKHKVSPVLYLRKCFPTFLIALTTASSSAAIESGMETCQKRLGIRESLCGFGVPLGTIMLNPILTSYFVLLCFSYADMYKIPISIGWAVTVVIISVISAVAVPPIPGGTTAIFSVMFMQLGIPSEALALALTMNLAFDFLVTGGEMLCLQLEISNVAHDTGMEDEKILKQL